MRTRHAGLVLCVLLVACSDDAPADGSTGASSSSEGSGTVSVPDGTSTTNTTDGTGSTTVAGTGSTTLPGTTAASESSTSDATSRGSSGSSSGSSGSDSDSGSSEESTSTTGDPMPECVPAPPDRDPLCGDGMPVGGELCHELSPPQINVGTFANDVWAGDLDGDMDADALALVDFPAEMAVLLNDGTGALMLDGSYAVIPGADTGAERVAVGDMNNDGSVDAVVAVSSPPSLRVMLGDGLGGFGAPIIAMLGQAPLAIDVGDIDGDGNLDAVLSDALSLSVLYGLGNGSFGMGLGIASPALTDGRALGIADFDDDGQLDVAVGFSQTVAVFLADGMGGLDAPWTLAVPVSGFGPQDLAIGDVNADMVPDILVADEQQNEIHELSGVGDGTFMLQPTVRDGSFVELGEGNSDCELDIYSRTFPSMLDELTIYPSDGMGGHLGAQTFLLGSGMVDMTTADFDGDGLSDVLFGIGPIGTVAVSFNQP